VIILDSSLIFVPPSIEVRGRMSYLQQYIVGAHIESYAVA